MHFANRKAALALLLLSPLLFTACGGGGSGGGETGSGAFAGIPATRWSSTSVPTRAYIYVADDFSSTVSSYNISMTTGQLSALGTVQARGLPSTVNVHPDGKFAYVTNTLENGVSAYRIEPATGALALLGVTEHVGADIGARVAVDASGRFLYMAINYAHDSNPFPPPQVPQEIATYRIDPDTGALTLASTLVIGKLITSIIVPPSGNVAYVSSPDSLSAYAIDPASGSLTLLAETAATGRLGVHPGGTYAYLAWPSPAAPSSGEVRVYKLDLATRTLTQVGVPVLSGFNPMSLAVHPSGNFVYVGNQLSHDVWIYRIDAATGALIPAGAPVSTGDSLPSPNTVAFDPSGKFAYIGVGASSILAYTVDPVTGALTPVGTPVARSRLALSIATAGFI